MSDSIAQRLPRLLVMIEDFGQPMASDDPFRFAKRKTQQAAWRALEGGMFAAAEILEAGDTFIRGIREAQTDAKP